MDTFTQGNWSRKTPIIARTVACRTMTANWSEATLSVVLWLRFVRLLSYIASNEKLRHSLVATCFIVCRFIVGSLALLGLVRDFSLSCSRSFLPDFLLPLHYSCLFFRFASSLQFLCATYPVLDTHLVHGIPVPRSPYKMVPCISRRNISTAEALQSIARWVDHKKKSVYRPCIIWPISAPYIPA